MDKLISSIAATGLLLSLSPVHSEILTYTENTNSSNELAIGYPVPEPVDSLTPLAGFRSYDSLFSQHQALALSNAEVRSSLVGQTHNGRDIYAYRFGDADTTTLGGQTEPAFLINGTIHAREWQSPEVVTEVMEQLVENKSDQSIVQFLLENTNIVILPVLNVDGFQQTQRFPLNVTQTPGTNSSSTPAQKFAQPRDGRMRRKNMPSVDESLSTDSDRLSGVDLNRNGSVFFGVQPDNSTPSSLIYGGTNAFSEPESQALLQAASLGPRNRLRFYQDTHSFSRVLFVPQPNNARRNAITNSLASKFQDATQAQGANYFPVIDAVGSGIPTTADYFAYNDLIPTWTLELEPPSGFQGVPDGGAFYGGTGASHSGFILPASEITRVRDQVAIAQMLMFYHQAGPAYVTQVRITNSAGDDVYHARWNETSNSRNLVIDASETLSSGETYSLWVSFSKPMRVRNASNSIAQYSGQSVGLAPRVTLTGNGGSGNFTRNIATSRSNWLNQAVDGFSFERYKDDSMKVDFTIPSDIPVSTDTGTTQISITIDVDDLSGLALDGNPQTVADWSNGAWTRYEDDNGRAGDTGGADTSYKISVDNAGLTLSAPQSSGGGGGGVFSWWLMVLMGVPLALRLVLVKQGKKI